MKYTCPVCGFAEMPYAPKPYNICPCCGTEFGVDDRSASYDTLRHTWIISGMNWFDEITKPTVDWNPSVQLIKAGLGAGLADFGRLTVTSASVEGKLETKPLLVLALSAADLKQLVFEVYAA